MALSSVEDDRYEGRAQLERVRGNFSSVLNSPGFHGTWRPGRKLGRERDSVCFWIPNPAGTNPSPDPEPDPCQRRLKLRNL